MSQTITSATPPSAASSVGFNENTFNSSVAIGKDWFKENFNGVNPASVNVTQNGGGGVTIAGGGDSYNAQVQTVQQTSTGWQGEAFGGGAYIQATLSWTGNYTENGGWPSFWSADVERMTGSSVAQWPGQPAGYSHYIEPDFMEYWSNNQYSGTIHDWYGKNGSQGDVQTNTGGFNLPTGVNPSQPNTYGFLWVPATSTAQGYAKWYFDGQQIGPTVHWNQYDPSAPPAPVNGSTAYSVLDTRHLALILGTNPSDPMTVSNVQVWQASAANDIFQGVPAPTPAPPAPTPAHDTLTLRMSEDAYKGDAQFTVSVNGQQVSGTMAASALDSTGDSNVFTLIGNWGANTKVQISFINDAYGGTSSTDRNLYVNSMSYDGNTYAGGALDSNGSLTVSTGVPSMVTAPADTLTLRLAEDAYQGNANFELTIDGKQVSTPQSVSALHSAGNWQNFTFAGNFGSGSHTIGVTFTNDAYAGTPLTDRNLYVDGVNLNGTHYGTVTTALLSTGNAAVYNVVTTH